MVSENSKRLNFFRKYLCLIIFKPKKEISPVKHKLKNLMSKAIQVMVCSNLGDHPQSLKILVFDSE